MTRNTRNQKKKSQVTSVKRTKSIQDVINSPHFQPFDHTKPIQVTKQIQKKPVSQPKKKAQPAKKAASPSPPKPKKTVTQKKKSNIKKSISNSSFKNQKFTEEEIPKYINMEELQEGIHEMDENFNFKEKFLGKEGAFSAYKILIGCFICNGSSTYIAEVEKSAGEELKKRGFQYDITGNFDNFTKRMNDYDIVWILSYLQGRAEIQKKQFYTAMDKFMKAKKSLFLWSDNDPLYIETNYVLEKYFDGMKMKGDYEGRQKVTKAETDEITKGTFDRNHSIGYGLNNLHEGVTICHPVNVHPDFKHFALNTEGNPLVSYAEENENHGRIILDCGYTKLYQSYWQNAGTHQYISNANVWLTGIPM